MSLILTQTDNAVTFEVGCSGKAAGITTAGRELIDGGTPGVNDVGVDPDNNTEAAVFALATTGGVGADTWAAGDYVVRLNVSGANGTSQWTETHICERTAGGAFNTVASLTGQTTDVSAAGIVSQTVNRGTDFTPAGTDSDLFIVIVLSNADSHGNSTTSFTPDQNVDTPIEVSSGQTVEVGLPVEADSALLLTRVKTAPVGQSVEDDVALALDIAATTVAFDAVSAVVAFVDDTADASITIGSGTNRKLLVYQGNAAGASRAIQSVTFDPGGADETTGAAVTGAIGTAGSDNKTGEYGFVDIDDAVSAGTYTVRVVVDGLTSRGSMAVIALENAATGDPTETTPSVTTGTGTTTSPIITPASDDNMIAEGLFVDTGQSSIDPDDGQTERFDGDAGDTNQHIAGSTRFVGTAAQQDAGWSWASGDDFVHIAVAVPTAGAGASVVVGQAVEDDSALPLAALKLVAAGQALEDDVAQALSALKTVQVGQPVEDDSALPVSVSKAAEVGQAVADDSALSLGSAQTILVGLPVEDDIGQALAVVKARIIGIASEDDLAQPLGVLKVSEAGQPISDDSALSANVVKLSQLSIAAASDTALPLTVGGSTQVGQTAEDDSALPVTAAKTKQIGQAAEGDEALSLSAGKTIIAGLPTEADSAVAASAVKLVVLGLPSTDDLALSLGVFKAVSVGLPASTAEALPLAGGAVEAPIKDKIKVTVRGDVITAKSTKDRIKSVIP